MVQDVILPFSPVIGYKKAQKIDLTKQNSNTTLSFNVFHSALFYAQSEVKNCIQAETVSTRES